MRSVFTPTSNNEAKRLSDAHLKRRIDVISNKNQQFEIQNPVKLSFANDVEQQNYGNDSKMNTFGNVSSKIEDESERGAGIIKMPLNNYTMNSVPESRRDIGILIKPLTLKSPESAMPMTRAFTTDRPRE